jgi:DNA repair protein RadD
MRGKPCVVCGWAPRTKGAAVEVIDGDLGLVQRDRRVLPTYISATERQLFYQQLMAIARQRGYAPGWAYFKFGEKFGDAKPPWSWRSLPPIEPEPHVLAWVRSRAIAYAKSALSSPSRQKCRSENRVFSIGCGWESVTTY